MVVCDLPSTHRRPETATASKRDNRRMPSSITFIRVWQTGSTDSMGVIFGLDVRSDVTPPFGVDALVHVWGEPKGSLPGEWQPVCALAPRSLAQSRRILWTITLEDLCAWWAETDGIGMIMFRLWRDVRTRPWRGLEHHDDSPLAATPWTKFWIESVPLPPAMKDEQRSERYTYFPDESAEPSLECRTAWVRDTSWEEAFAANFAEESREHLEQTKKNMTPRQLKKFNEGVQRGVKGESPIDTPFTRLMGGKWRK
jgi:hypothetical protein